MLQVCKTSENKLLNLKNSLLKILIQVLN